MSDPGFNPFGGLPFFGDLAKMVAGQGPISWDAARQLALSIATGGESEPNVDPLDRLSFEGLGRVAELQVTTRTGLEVGLARITPVTPSMFAMRSLDAYRPLFERLAGSLGASDPATFDPAGFGSGEEQDPEMAMLAGLLRMMSPLTLGMSAGSMVGHLARRSFGQYHLPIPRPASDEVLVLPRAIDAFAEDWSLGKDDLRLWVCLHELTHHAVLAVPHVRTELEALIRQFVSGFRPDGNALSQRLNELDPTDPSMLGIQQMFSDPEVLLGAMSSDQQRATAPRLDALVAVIVGYVDHILDTIGNGLIGSYRVLAEAVRRHRLEADQAEVFVARLLGLSIGQDQIDRGKTFVGGVIERAGEAGLARLWESARCLPTPAEVDAPGLWLARIELPEQPG
ncbi:MAG: zinc-dependent metalloprotease [Acidimicrobiia bacterium]